MTHAPEESLTPCNVVNTQSYRDTEGVGGVYKSWNETIASFRFWRAIQGRSNGIGVASLETAVRSKIK